MGIGRPSSAPRVRLAPTVAGWLFLVVGAIVCYSAWRSQAAMLFVLFGVMVGAMSLSMAMARRMIAGVELKRDVPEQAWQNQTIHLGYYLRNSRRRGSCLGLSMNERASRSIQSVRGYCVHLPPGSFFRSGARFVARERGRIELDGVEVETCFPFGLIAARRLIQAPATLVVWPAKGQLKRRILICGAVESSSAAPSQATGGQDEFFGLRDYRSNDNPRWIHWRRSANRQAPVIREMCQPLPEILWVILDTALDDLSEIAQTRRERLIRFAGTAIEHTLARGYKVGLALGCSHGPVTIPPIAGKGQMHELLGALATIDINTQCRLEHTVAALRHGSLRDAQVLLIATDGARVDPVALRPIRAHCRSLTVVGDRELPFYFEDDPLAAGEVR
ncbi:MAG: DUF58 domain-containing protein [Phycisphaerae bacterium]|jgi:uncharacterized protein (DUF58 family)